MQFVEQHYTMPVARHMSCYQYLIALSSAEMSMLKSLLDNSKNLLVGTLSMAIALLSPMHYPSMPDAATPWPNIQASFPQKLSGSHPEQSPPILADLDGTGKLEIVVAGRTLTGPQSLGCQGRVYVYNPDGSKRWETTTPADINSSPAVADLNRDGIKDIVVGMGSWMQTNTAASRLSRRPHRAQWRHRRRPLAL